ncbi:MAG: 3-deoxy-D-manno-octulosonic acid transferase [Candidatus Methylacidiphilales bacterium]
MRLFLFFYNLLFVPVFLVLAPTYLLRMWRRGHSTFQWRERFGILDAEKIRRIQNRGRPVLIQAVSVGEVKLAATLIGELRQRRPQCPVVISTTTITGRRLAESLDISGCEVVFHALDMPSCVKRLMTALQPRMVLLMEQELWPNQLAWCRRHRVPVWLINARLSLRSATRFRRFSRWLSPVLESLDFVGVQSERAVENFVRAGFPAHAIFPVGSMKYDVVEEAPSGLVPSWWKQTGWLPEDKVVVCGSTHPGEEAWLYHAARGAVPGLKWVMVPRHAERAVAVCAEFRSQGVAAVLKSSMVSSLDSHADPFEVLVVDTTGELAGLYELGWANVIGKSFLGVGGQNFLEAARVGRPVLFGCEMSNFEDTARDFLESGAAIEVSDAADFKNWLKRLAEHPEEAETFGKRARNVFLERRGATRRQAGMVAGALAASEDCMTRAN